MKRMLINATQSEELRVALVDGQILYDLDIENSAYQQKKSNVYKGRIVRVEPSLEAAFVDYGAERNGFLPLKEIAREYFPEDYSFKGRPNIKEVVRENQEVIVQIDKEERGSKGAALTTFISLAGSYLVLMPNNPRAGGISRRIEGEERSELKELLSQIETPKGMGLIVRTAGLGKSVKELNYDLDILQHHWNSIQQTAQEKKAPFLIHQESNVIFRSIRDYLREDVSNIIIDHKNVYDEAKQYIKFIRPDFEDKVQLYQSEVPLFTHYQIESQIESAFQREVRLPSGGSIVIDPTEALTSIDINSAKSTKGGDIEETAFHTNLEAADEIARQIRLRDLGGLVVIDFIDMSQNRHQREVEDRMRVAVQQDRARVQLSRISRFGLLELSRQRIKPSLGESTATICPRCNGKGNIRGIESLALSILRLIEEEAIKQDSSQIDAVVPVDVSAYLLNEKRKALRIIEQRHNVEVYIIPNQHILTPHYSVVRHTKDMQSQEVSYNKVTEPSTNLYVPRQHERMVQKSSIQKQLPKKPSKPSLFSRFMSFFTGLFQSESIEEKPVKIKRSDFQKNKKPHKKQIESDTKNQQRKPKRKASNKPKEELNQTSQEEKVQARRERRKNRRSVRADSDKNQTKPVTAKETKEQKEVVDAPTIVNETVVEKSAVKENLKRNGNEQNSSTEESGSKRTRRTPRHLRAAGQKRKSEATENTETFLTTDELLEQQQKEMEQPKVTPEAPVLQEAPKEKKPLKKVQKTKKSDDVVISLSDKVMNNIENKEKELEPVTIDTPPVTKSAVFNRYTDMIKESTSNPVEMELIPLNKPLGKQYDKKSSQVGVSTQKAVGIAQAEISKP